MQHIDEATKGLGQRIVEDFNKVELDEAGRFARTMGRIGNALASPFSASARGKAKQAKAVSFLMDKFKEFARGRPYTPQLLYQYLSGTFGQHIADTIMKGGNNGGSNPPPNDATPASQNTPPNTNSTTNTANTEPSLTNAEPTDATTTATSNPNNTTTPQSPSQIPGTPEQKAKTLMGNTPNKQTTNPTIPQPAGANATPGQIIAKISQATEQLADLQKGKNPNQQQVERQQKQIMMMYNQLLATAKAKGKDSPEYQSIKGEAAKLKSALTPMIPQIEKGFDLPESVLPRRRKIR